MKQGLVIAIVSMLAFSYMAKADASDPFRPVYVKPSQSDFGGVGFMQMPSARMAATGEFSINGDWSERYHKYNLSLQLMPWLETTVRYTLVEDLLFSEDPEFSGDTRYTDKSIDFKLRLRKESNYLPQLAVGFRDFGGTGLFDGEYFVASKRYKTLDFSLGLGWGYLGTRDSVSNPACQLADGFCQRPADSERGGNGGMIDYDRWFKGTSAIFGGVEYQSPWQPLRFKLEYDGNDYSQDFPVVQANIDMRPRTPWNVGMLYRLGEWGDLRLSYQRGNAFALGFTLRTNFNQLRPYWSNQPLPQLKTAKAASSLNELDWQALGQELSDVAGYRDATFYQQGERMVLAAKQGKYRDRDEARYRAATVLAGYLPDSISEYRIQEQRQHMPVTEVAIDANAFKARSLRRVLNEPAEEAIRDVAQQRLDGENIAYSNKRRLSYSMEPKLVQSFGGAEDFYLYSLSLRGNASYWLNDKLLLSGGLALNLLDNYDKFNYIAPPDGTFVPRVRTLARAYVSDNSIRLNHLQLTWFQAHEQSVYSQWYAGHLESMFAGVGSEFIYRPKAKPWALSLDVNAIAQREPDSWFNVYQDEVQFSARDNQKFKVLTQGYTGHLSAYYSPSWPVLENTLFKLSLGRFLAGDNGARLDISKQFDSGIIAGAYASGTDMSAEEFGEGSFTKGFYISIPLDILTLNPTTSRVAFNWQPITRDGGQVLSRQYELFKLTDPRSPWMQRPYRYNKAN